MSSVAWLSQRDPFHSRQTFAEACMQHGVAPPVSTISAWEVDYLKFLLRDATWHWIDTPENIAALKPDVVVFSSNEFPLSPVVDAWVPKILIQLSDEWGRTPTTHWLTDKVPLVLRQYRFNHYYWPPNVRQIPLGFMASMFPDPATIENLTHADERAFKWSFVGGLKGDRAVAIETFRMWGPNRHDACPPSELARVYSNSEFVLCPRGNVSMDCFRNYEATICGAIPVVAGCSKEQFAEAFSGLGNPPWVFAESWDAALAICKRLVESGEVRELRRRNLSWWRDEVESIREAMQLALDHPERPVSERLNSSLISPNQPRRNELCPCGSHKRFKHCHGRFDL